jgi:hypothetical protein
MCLLTSLVNIAEQSSQTGRNQILCSRVGTSDPLAENRSLTDALVWKKSGVGVSFNQCTKLPPLADEQSAQTGQGQSNK